MVNVESIAIELFDAYQGYQMERDSGVIGISWENVPECSKKVWLACAKPFCDRLEAAESLTRPHDGTPKDCPTYYDGCHCTVETLVFNIKRAETAENRIKELTK